jgi:hypothetical protein
MKFLSQISVNTRYTLPIVDGTNGQVLSTDGAGTAYWRTIVAGSGELDGLSDVSIVSLSSDQMLRYGLRQGDTVPVWHNFTPNFLTPSSSIDALNDVTITSAATGQVLQWSGSAWVNATVTSAGYVSKVQHEVKAGVAITKGQALYVTGADGTNIVVGKASNVSEAMSSKTMGLAAASAAVNGKFFVVTEGLIDGLNTSSANAGDAVWLGVDGALIFGLTNKPVAPAHLVYIGVVTRAHANNGEIFVSIQNGFELKELHDVLINGVTTGQLLRRESDGLWKNWTPNFLTSLPAHNHNDAYYTKGEIDSFFNGEEEIEGYNRGSWDAAYNDKINSASFSTTTGVLTLTQQDTGTVTVDLDGRYLESLPSHNHDDRYYTETESDSRYPLSRGTLGTTTNIGDATGFGNNLASGTYTRNYVGHSGQVWVSHDTGGSVGNFALEVTYYGAMYVHTNVDSSSWVTKQIWTSDTFANNSSNWNTAFGWGNHSGLYLGLNSKAADSELLDGVDESRFVYGNSNTRRGTNLISNWNQNDYPDVAFLSAENGGTNAPSSDYTYGTQYSFHRSGAAYRTQLVTALYSDTSIYVRNSRDSDVWTSWKRLWHSGDFTSSNVSSWNTAYGWGDHASVGYATEEFVTGQGYLTSLPAHNHDDRYYTETESDTRYVNTSGDTMSGNLTLSGYANPHITLTTTGGDYSYLALYDGSTYGYIIKNVTSSTANGVLAGSLYLYTDNSKATQIVHNGVSNAAFLSGGDVYIRGQIYVVGNGASTGTQVVYNTGTWGINITGNADTATNLRGTGGSFIQSTSTGTSYINNYQVRENSGGGSNTNEIYAPQLAFHWSGVVASSIMMEASGRMAIRNNPGGSYENFIAAVVYSSGYGDSTQWNTAYNDRISSATVTGTTTKTLTLTQGDGGTVTASWTDYDTDNDAQQLSYDSGANQLSISNGNSIELTGLATEEFVASQGYITGSYLPLSGGTLSGAVVVNLGNVSSDTVAFKVGGPANYDSLTIGMEDTPDYDAFIASYGNDIRFYSGKGVATENHSFYWFTSKAGTAQHSVVAMQLDHNQNLTIAGTFTEQSSIRYKENVKSIPSVSQKMEQLDAVSYNKIGSNQEEIGLIAEDVAELFPEVVKYDNEGRPDGVNYSRLSVILLKAVQELTERVNKLENK